MDLTVGYRAAPGCCFMCGHAGQDRPVLDLCRDDPGTVRRTRVYLCGECVMAAAQKVGALTGQSVVSAAQVSNADEWEARYEQVAAELRRLQDIIVEMMSLTRGRLDEVVG